MFAVILMHNLKRELTTISRVLRPKYRGMHFIVSNYMVQVTGTNTVLDQKVLLRPLSTKILSKNFDENPINKASEQQSNSSSVGPSFLDTDLKTFLTDCVWNRRQDDGLNVLLNCRRQSNFSVINLECCHILMETYAKQGDFEKISQICDIMKEVGIAPDPQTYVFILECLARAEWSNEVLRLVEKYVEQSAKNNISLNDIFDKSICVRDQKELILRIIHRIDENFQPVHTLPKLDYSNKLLLALNSDSTDSNAFPRPNFTPNELRSFSVEQMEIESKNGITIDDISASFPENSPAFNEFCRKKLNQLYGTWHTQICEIFCKKVNALQNNTEISEDNIYMCLTLFKPEQYADMMLDSLRRFVQEHRADKSAVIPIYTLLGRQIYLRYEWQLKTADGVVEQTKAIYDKYCDEITTNRNSDNYRQKWQRLMFADHNLGFCKRYGEWSDFRCLQIGKFLYELLKENIKIDENLFDEKSGETKYQPVFGTYGQIRNRKSINEIHPALLRLHQGVEMRTISFTTDQIPMLCPPMPWISHRTGGFLLIHTPFVQHIKGTTEMLGVLDRTPAIELYSIFDNLNQASNVPWAINSRVLDIAIEIYNKQFDGNEPGKILNVQQKMRIADEQVPQKLTLANHFRNKTFWFPHNREPCGRIFTISNLLTYTQSDLQRSLVTFHEKKPLGKDGLKWLKLHCINTTKSKSHESLDDRLAFADQCLDDILDSADNPLTGRLWWLNSSNPFQTLACCIEIADAVRSPDPTEFLSSLPIHQDGTCNALQHFAALSRNRELAESVNLCPKEKPQDAYMIAVDLIERKRAEDAEKGFAVAKLLQNHVNRNTLKKLIVNRINGMEKTSRFVEKALSDIETFPKYMVKVGAQYLETKHKSISPMLFRPASEILKWMKECESFIFKECGKSVEWLTPLNVPVIIPYESAGDMQHAFNRGFPIYFIWSLDTSHMILTSLNCERAGLTFASEHESFATHACTVDQMNKICREQFLVLYSRPVLEDLSAYFCMKYLSNQTNAEDSDESKDVHIFRKFPKPGDFDLREVLNSVYFFS